MASGKLKRTLGAAVALTMFSPVAALPYTFIVVLRECGSTPPGIYDPRRAELGPLLYNLEWSAKATPFQLILMVAALLASFYLSLPLLVAAQGLMWSALSKLIPVRWVRIMVAIALSGVVFLATYLMGLGLDLWSKMSWT